MSITSQSHDEVKRRKVSHGNCGGRPRSEREDYQSARNLRGAAARRRGREYRGGAGPAADSGCHCWGRATIRSAFCFEHRLHEHGRGCLLGGELDRPNLPVAKSRVCQVHTARIFNISSLRTRSTSPVGASSAPLLS